MNLPFKSPWIIAHDSIHSLVPCTTLALYFLQYAENLQLPSESIKK